jgi:coenzyme F420-reducing hydrogenase alpha subunit
MAFYLKDDFDKISTRQGIKLISDFLMRYKEVVHIEVRHIGTQDEVILIQTLAGGKDIYKNYSNTVSFDTQRNNITINPVFFNGENSTIELKEFIQSIPQLLRGQKLESLIND